MGVLGARHCVCNRLLTAYLNTAGATPSVRCEWDRNRSEVSGAATAGMMPAVPGDQTGPW